MDKTKPAPLFALYRYVNDDGEFDYERYRSVQEAANIHKIQDVWVQRETLEVIVQYLRTNAQAVETGICHGTRRGVEQGWFAELTGARVIGTEISKTASEFPNTIQHDFHELKPEWRGAFDFVYSNAFDHSYDPAKAINAWMASLKDDGVCFIEHTQLHGTEAVNETDPFGAPLEVMPFLFLMWGQGRLYVSDILKSPKKVYGHTIFVLVLRKKLALKKG